MFDDLRRGFTEDFQRIKKFEMVLPKKKTPQKVRDFAFLAFVTFKMTSKIKVDLIHPTSFGWGSGAAF